MYQVLTTLPNDSLAEIWQFIEFVKYKKPVVTKAPFSVKLGGLLRDYHFDLCTGQKL